MEFKFDPKQPYQEEAIVSLIDLFEGQPTDADSRERTLAIVKPATLPICSCLQPVEISRGVQW